MQTLDLGEDGRHYAEEILSGGSSGLAEELSRIGSRIDSVLGVVPSGTTLERAKRVDEGGLTSRAESIQWLSKRLLALHSGCVVFQDIWAKGSDLALRTPTYPNYAVVKDAVYYYALARAAKPAVLEKILRQITSYLVVGVYLQIRERDASLATVLQTESISRLASRVSEIYLGAYDQESFLIASIPRS
jgi:hypothetical protein